VSNSYDELADAFKWLRDFEFPDATARKQFLQI
jgi:hypothetical protein